jgi:diaminohydroxyphosphoribosylaminopyrimidine deaminase/5-amino-6-(5-phosphoribosylamino)uracil reductase
VAPNPLVGALVAGETDVAGEGFHAEYGREHAEVQALRSAGEACRGGTLYVTLEPCAHQGKTPPCVDAIIESGIRRVVVACRDPNPEAEGGIEHLRAAGIDVVSGVEVAAASRQNAGFLWSQLTGRPFVTLKLALSLDARIAERPGVRTSISGPEASRRVHRLRAGQSAILVGRVTAEVDDPLLTVRGESPRVPPVRVVLDPGLKLSSTSRLATTTTEAPLWVATAPDMASERRAALENAGARLLELRQPGPHRLDLEQLEGGGQVAASFLGADLVQRLHLIFAPRLLGTAGVPAFGSETRVGSEWRLAASEQLGDDTLLEYERPWPAEPSAKGRAL